MDEQDKKANIMGQEIEQIIIDEFKTGEMKLNDQAAKKFFDTGLSIYENTNAEFLRIAGVNVPNEMLYNAILDEKKKKMEKVAREYIRGRKFSDLIAIEVFVLKHSLVTNRHIGLEAIKENNQDNLALAFRNLRDWDAQEASEELIEKFIKVKEENGLEIKNEELGSIINYFQSKKAKEEKLKLKAVPKEEETTNK